MSLYSQQLFFGNTKIFSKESNNLDNSCEIGSVKILDNKIPHIINNEFFNSITFSNELMLVFLNP